MTKDQDIEYKDEIIERVEEYTDGYMISFDGGTCFSFSKESGIRPEVEQTARFYGKGFGWIVRGLDIDGQEVFYRTPEQQEEYNRQEVENMKAKRKADFAKAKSRLDLDYDDLPRVFQKRLDILRRNNPDFRWEHEAYEMTVCKEVVNIASTLKTVEAVRAFRLLRWDQQAKQVKPLDDGHSGNSWGCACFLAELYLANPKLVEIAHGALCPLVGCKDYGCYAGYKESQSIPLPHGADEREGRGEEIAS